MNKCCEKCFTTYTEHDYPAHTTYDACINLSCPCHSKDKSEEPTTTDWRDRFETQFGNYTIGTNGEAQMFDTFTLYELVQDFIAKERTQARNEFGAELRETIIGLRAGKKNAKEGLNVLRDFGYDEALSAVLALLPEQESKL